MKAVVQFHSLQEKNLRFPKRYSSALAKTFNERQCRAMGHNINPHNVDALTDENHTIERRVMETIDSGVGVARKVSLNRSQETRKFSFCLKLFCPEFWKLLVKRKKLNRRIYIHILWIRALSKNE